MKTVTLEEFMLFEPCYSREQLEAIRGDKEHWTALDILALDAVPKEDRLWAMLREELIDKMLLHEFSCRCAKRALDRIDDPDPRIIRAIEVKRAWMRGDATDAELKAARDAAHFAAWAAAEDAALDAALYTACDVARAAEQSAAGNAERAAWHAAWAAAEDAERAARADARVAAFDDALEAERQWQIDELKRMLKEEAASCN